jgi:uncharacterized glyoxalase superfamily protein PhnB
MAGDHEVWFSGHGPGFWEKLGVENDMWIGVWVDDVDAVHARVVAAGIAADAPEDKDYDVRSFSVKDPEGYSWGFMKRIGIDYKQTIPTAEGGLEEVRGSGFRG